MRVFVTGATGFVGTAVVQDLRHHGFEVLGLSRSADASKKLRDMGVDVHRGTLDDHAALRDACAQTDAVIHLGFQHDFKNFAAMCAMDKGAIEALGKALAGTKKRFIVTSGTAFLDKRQGQIADEDSQPRLDPFNPRQSENTAMALANRGVNACIVRLANSVHGPGDHAFVPHLVSLAKQNSFSGYIGTGANRWTAVHRLDAAALFRLVLQKGVAGERYNGCADEGVRLVDIASAIGRKLGIETRSVSQADAPRYFDWFANFVGFDFPASSKRTQQRLGWVPKQPNLLADLASDSYFPPDALRH